ncbi:hypothetical protein ALC56_11457 [Trachymyrmex septentrionalis]|uniref:Uncharacterized protein n=1 Tax=Trachymyrmex septentrionalis TaxID=34720 RepID=A0A195F1A2_9HYME|nr:hypothetical protein ALC56_11457 [Trachymyrmex septentrionalis]
MTSRYSSPCPLSYRHNESYATPRDSRSRERERERERAPMSLPTFPRSEPCQTNPFPVQVLSDYSTIKQEKGTSSDNYHRESDPTDFYDSSQLIWFVTARIHLLPKVLVRMISNILAMLIKKMVGSRRVLICHIIHSVQVLLELDIMNR